MMLFENIEPDLELEDGLARFEAIHPHHSFIVQAPAGSGKTALLTQRFLALLSQVDMPEQIMAMTFTKKAAAEMQERVFSALKLATQPLNPKADLYEKNTWYLAESALKNSRHHDWQLLQNPHRLRIRTLDSMNTYLVQQMPLLSRFGAQVGIVEQADALYLEAARDALNDARVATSVASLFQLVNGNLRRAEGLLVQMLKKRDQWMPLLSRFDVSGNELSVAENQTNALNATHHAFNESLHKMVFVEFLGLHQSLEMQFHLLEEVRLLLVEASLSTLPEMAGMQTLDIRENLPGRVNIAQWKLLANVLLTGKGELRKTVNVKNGFPGKTADEKELKKHMVGCLEALRAENGQAKIESALSQIAALPDPVYSAEQWRAIEDLIALLKITVGYLKVAFSSAGQTDFIELAQAASEALGSEDQPTDLAQRLDYQLKHLLIDEFQDTSVSQFDLLKKLVAGWVDDDDHTLFIVGDPMQSIYRFREAEVGNFLEVWQGSLGQFVLEQKNLTVNFRSTFGVVDWVNKTFPTVLAKQNQIERGAVCYTASSAYSKESDTAVFPHWALNQSAESEIAEVLAVIEQRLPVLEPEQTIGILGRSRGHLMPIADALKQKGIHFRAVDLETLNDRQEIQDAQALTRALLHLSDRPAWLALLRSPAIGLSLKDLHQLLGDARQFRVPVWQILMQHAQTQFSALTEKGSLRLQRVYPILENALSAIGSLAWSRLLKETWLVLDMAQTVESSMALQNIEAYWRMIESLENNPMEVFSFSSLETALEKLYALPDTSEQSAKIELMTMHKSKGLEFDTVILPSLGKTTRADDKPLLTWLNFKSENHDHLVMAPLDQKGQNTSDLVGFIQQFEKEKQDYERGRLLYVAATRAKKQLHLFGSISISPTQKAAIDNEVAVLSPDEKSLLKGLWSSQAMAFDVLLSELDFPEVAEENESVSPAVTRLPLYAPRFIERYGFTLEQTGVLSQGSDFDADKSASKERKLSASETTIQLSPDQACVDKSVGNLVHRMLEEWVGASPESLTLEKVQQQTDFYRYWLTQQGVSPNLLDEVVQRVQTSLSHAVQNEKVRWALSATHADSATELALSSKGISFEALADANAVSDSDTSVSAHQTEHHVVDRTFVDEQGVRWIVDYKTSYWSPDSEVSRSEFIATRVLLYTQQLERYGRLFNQIEKRPQKQALYFTHLDEWIEL